MSSLPARSIHALSRHWVGRLAPYRRHLNDEHREALVAEALRFVGFELEEALADSEYWAAAPLARRVAVLLYLVDRGAILRQAAGDQIIFRASDAAEAWAVAQPALAPYLTPTLELLAATRRATSGRPVPEE